MADQKKDLPNKKLSDDEIERRKKEVLKKHKNGIEYRNTAVSSDELLKTRA